jgi:hypothetical protein
VLGFRRIQPVPQPRRRYTAVERHRMGEELGRAVAVVLVLLDGRCGVAVRLIPSEWNGSDGQWTLWIFFPFSSVMKGSCSTRAVVMDGHAMERCSLLSQSSSL